MSIPVIAALRQPKQVNKPKKSKKFDDDYVIITMKDNKKLVVNSDGYHGIVRMEEKFVCVLCNYEINLDEKLKADHKVKKTHLKTLTLFPHVESFRDNLIRQLNKNGCYCTICNVMVSTHYLMCHVDGELHKQELEKAVIRANTYKPK
ncbi:PREDICTED: uncharacterized protein LOC106114644 [Papilio xuthus]|uniref:Uncharacterized protein LOC106114644 n=1 Tax=Papilio xuthus TaxID=66420 RepID=A0A194Q4C1_PAPXU|nr:PREDICTED: uncharacterized protein LOC106114644 [Papilio xuthus]KPJ00388.1 hypothetical protein RR46_06978 [Papilio xuthus]